MHDTENCYLDSARMFEFSLPEFLIFCGSTLLIAMLLMEVLDWSCVLAALECPMRAGPFVYGDSGGPRMWKCIYPESRGCEQSPVNIVGRTSTELALSECLKWSGYDEEPLSLSIANDGNTVVLCGLWTCPSRPSLKGGSLKGSYDFHSVAFRWGPSDDEGSEHSLDYVRYPLELQVVHTKRALCPTEIGSKPRDTLAIVSYFFQVTSSDNPYLDHIVTNLWRVTAPGTYAHIPVFPLEWLLPSFQSKFYTYSGSITHPPCSEIVTWIIQPKPIAISPVQMAEFRKICSTEGPILSNSRPVQKLNDREVYFYA